MKVLQLLRFQIRCLRIHASRKNCFWFFGLLSLKSELTFRSKTNFCQKRYTFFYPLLGEIGLMPPFLQLRLTVKQWGFFFSYIYIYI